MRSLPVSCLATFIVLAVAFAAVADVGSSSWLRDGDEIVLFFECVDSCGIPPDWTVIPNGNYDMDTWGDGWPCGEGMHSCPPGDPGNGWSFVCMNSPMHAYGPMDELLISPLVDVSGCGSLALRFTHAVEYWSFCTAPNEVHARVEGEPFQVVWTMPCSEPYASGVLYDEEIDLAAFAGEHSIQVAFRYYDYGCYGAEHWWVDDVMVVGAPYSSVEAVTWTMIKTLYRP